MTGGHVCRVGGEPGRVPARVRGDALPPVIHVNQRLAGMHFQALTDVLVRD